MLQPDPQTNATKRSSLGFWEKVAYGVAAPVDNWPVWQPKAMANQVFNMSLGISPSVISLSFLIFRLWDGILDPLMGWISDNTRTRWGRRRPYLVVGAVLVGLWYPVMWWVPAHWSDAAITVWFVASGLILYALFTVWSMPYHSLVMEMTPDYDERTNVNAYRAFFSKFGMLVTGWLWALTQLPFFADKVTGEPDTLMGMRWLAIALGVIIIAAGVLPGIFVKERYYEKVARSGAKVPFWASLKTTLGNRPFRVLCAVTVLFTVGTGMVNGFGIYLLVYYVFGGDQSGAAILTGFQYTLVPILGTAALPLLTKISRGLGKIRTLRLCMGVMLLFFLSSWYTYNPDYPWLYIASIALYVPGQTGLWMMIPSMSADVIDHDELETGRRREGSFAAAYSWLTKVSYSVAFGLSGPILELTGFDVAYGDQQPAEAIFNMRLANMIIPTCSILAGMWLLSKFSLTPGEARRIRDLLENRRGEI